MSIFSYIGALFVLPKDIWVLKEKASKKRYQIAYYFKLKMLGSYVGHNCVFDSIPCLPHGLKGIFISGGSHIGKNCVIFQQVTIGGNTLSDSNNSGAPVIGDGCYIGAGAKIIGDVRIGDNCRIGAGAVVVEDVPSNSKVFAPKAHIIQSDTALDNRFISYHNGKKVYWDNGEWKDMQKDV